MKGGPGMHLLPAASARAFLAGFGAMGLDVAALRRALAVGDGELAMADGVLPAEAFDRLWKEASRQAPREELPTELGLAIPFGAFGPLDYLAGSSPDVEAGFHALRSHFRQVARIAVEIEVTPTGADVRLLNLATFPGVEISDEMTIAIFSGRFRDSATSPFRASEIRLTRPPPRRPTRHEALLGAPVRFGCSVAGMSVPRAAWKAKLRRADPALLATMRQLADRLELGGDGDELESAIRARLRTLLPDGTPPASSVARSLALSERTLHRRLSDRGKTWRGVLDAFREAEAERLLVAGRPLAEVALRVGFSDQTAWNRAFRRWKGKSPTDWLEERSQGAGSVRRPAGAGRSTGRPPRRRT